MFAWVSETLGCFALKSVLYFVESSAMQLALENRETTSSSAAHSYMIGCSSTNFPIYVAYYAVQNYST
jgi:hypothetical protein